MAGVGRGKSDGLALLKERVVHQKRPSSNCEHVNKILLTVDFRVIEVARVGGLGVGAVMTHQRRHDGHNGFVVFKIASIEACFVDGMQQRQQREGRRALSNEAENRRRRIGSFWVTSSRRTVRLMWASTSSSLGRCPHEKPRGHAVPRVHDHESLKAHSPGAVPASQR